jgi:hypothetical protein
MHPYVDAARGHAKEEDQDRCAKEPVRPEEVDGP